MSEPILVLKNGREKSVFLRHPWIFASAVAEVSGNPQNGETVLICDAKKQPLAKAAFSPNSQIRARVWTWNTQEIINTDFLKSRIQTAIQRRLLFEESEHTTALRLVFGEADGIPGLIVDRYNNTLVVQILSAGPERYRHEIYDVLNELLHPDQIYERSDVDVRTLEGLEERNGLICGSLIQSDLVISENGIKYLVDVREGQKTGFYIDQRRNRQKIQKLVKNKDVLNCFCYTGGFTLNALAGEAKSVVSVDSSAPALEQVNQNIKLNGFDESKNQNIEGDVFKLLRLFRDQAKSFDVIILDPPKFAPTVSQAEKAARGYKDINLLAFKMLRPGGILATFSCSGGISRDLFQKIITGAAYDANVDARILDQLSQSPDHPVALNFPESFYLKGLICQK